jgi:hypothetical protein
MARWAACSSRCCSTPWKMAVAEAATTRKQVGEGGLGGAKGQAAAAALRACRYQWARGRWRMGGRHCLRGHAPHRGPTTAWQGRGLTLSPFVSLCPYSVQALGGDANLLAKRPSLTPSGPTAAPNTAPQLLACRSMTILPAALSPHSLASIPNVPSWLSMHSSMEEGSQLGGGWDTNGDDDGDDGIDIDINGTTPQ